MSFLLDFYSTKHHKDIIVPSFFDAKLEDVLKSNSGKEAVLNMFIACLKTENMNPFDLLLAHKFLVDPTLTETIPEDLEIPKLVRQ